MKASFRDAWKLTAPYWRSKERGKAYFLLAAIIGLNLGQVYINVRINKWNNDFYNALQDLQKDDFYSLIITFTVLAFIWIIMTVYKIYLRQMLQIKWRRWLTNHYLDRWLNKQAYYRLQVEGNPADNPDQRISEDIGQFIDITLQLSLGLLSSIVTLFSFLMILWNLSGPADFVLAGMNIHVPGYMVWAALFYSIAGTAITRWIGHPLIGLTYRQQKFEADFRFSLVRLREYGESVAFYKGEGAEKENFVKRFTAVFDNFWEIMKRQKAVGWFTSGYGQIAIIFPYVVTAPAYFSKKIKLGDLMQTASAFGEVQGALSYIVDVYVSTDSISITSWFAVIERLSGFTATVERFAAESEDPDAFRAQLQESPPSVAVAGLDVRLPSGEILLKGISFNVDAGNSLLIQGPSGCGKSTLLRTIAGIWPYANGNLRLAADARSIFLPQKPYLPMGTLRQALIYPHTADVSESVILELLKTCQLGHLSGRLNEQHAWSHVLSLGEQQRIAFFRALLFKQDIIFLDEATSALDEKAEEYFYELLRKKLPKAVIVSVGHRQTLKQWHDHVLDLGKKKAK
ncbi:MAG: ABC transporter ATP-binding protein/permease [Alphaproteobacteria bacterium]|nr:MAG: ABC transporter ATP-binding protein/permease [Alphaproteobacteria bacterium]